MRIVRGAVLVLVVAVVAVVNESASDVANQLTLACIVGGAGVAGFLWPRRAWLVGALVGAVVAVEQAVGLLLHLENPAIHLPPGWLGPASLLVLVVPAVLAAWAGAALRRAADARRPAQH